MLNLIDAENSKAWPFIEALKIKKRLENQPKEVVIFETGYGPSGLPHIGTFGEVVRTIMVKNAFEAISDIPTKLYVVSDDMDGLRKVPDNIPNQDLVKEHIGKALTTVPDPYETHNSFGEHMNSRLRSFLDSFGFEYEFKSATECYKEGIYDDMLISSLNNYEKIMDIMLPTLGEERQKTYSPFMPVCKKTGRVLQVPITKIDKENKLIYYVDNGKEVSTTVTGGNCKLQWKPDLGMRWAALGVDFEMYGKDHLASAPLYSRICNAIGGKAPEQYFYELFLDQNGQKISKSKGNGISIEEWLSYAPSVSLSYYMFVNPRKAKRLYFDVIPKAVDEYLTHLKKYFEQDKLEQIKNPVWHIHNGNPPKLDLPISFALLLNLASVCHAENKEILWGFIDKYAQINEQEREFLDKLVEYSINYYNDFVKPHKEFRKATEIEANAMKELAKRLVETEENDAEQLQSIVYSVGKDFEFENLRDWFKALYEVLIGQSQGPRFGSFIALYGKKETADLINKSL